ncbi:PLP-dependent aminotransferase family protein [Oceanicella sp. SM1341]|uniref:MocR-like pyridoxine biosynthesis transcription factor PdxR n=1 Tax=Oceanicella sp. SM1341 TaxID=1548889 RepID=UPI000E4E530E|nr:PLP-dependent aminotransferase family protein [Oceanicella sp. SM1341]
MLELQIPGLRERSVPIQSALRQALVLAIGEGRLTAGQKLPPPRALAGQLGVARNTVTAAYDELVARGYVNSVERRGYFVAEGLDARPAAAAAPGVDWGARLRIAPGALPQIEKPADWQAYPYPFIYGQVDPGLFPISVWRGCSRAALGRSALDYWAADRAMEDDPMLLEQIRRHVLPARGIFAARDEVMITLGAQHGLYLLSRLLAGPGTEVGVELPGYPDTRNVFQLGGARLRPLPVDGEGLRMDDAAMRGLAALVVTPAHHCPSMVTLSDARRAELLALARRHDTVVIEDDYEGEICFGAPRPALKAADRDGRVVYLGTLSKILAPGVRLGYMVAPAPLLAEARALRRLMHRSAPLNNQRTAAIFLAEGHYLGLVRSMRAALEERWRLVDAGLDRLLPRFRRAPATGGTAFWLECPVDARAFAARAAAHGVMVESGDPFVGAEARGRFIRLGISYIDKARIGPGLELLARAAAELGAG